MLRSSKTFYALSKFCFRLCLDIQCFVTLSHVCSFALITNMFGRVGFYLLDDKDLTETKKLLYVIIFPDHSLGMSPLATYNPSCVGFQSQALLCCDESNKWSNMTGPIWVVQYEWSKKQILDHFSCDVPSFVSLSVNLKMYSQSRSHHCGNGHSLPGPW